MVYLISTSHFEDRIWFRDEEDFISGMNYVAISSAKCKVLIFCFVLMSNHVHFVVEGDKSACMLFISRFKQLFSTYLLHKYEAKQFLRHNGCDIRPLQGEDSLERAIAYVLMNPVAANICLAANSYPWGSGNCYFNACPINGVPIKGMSARKRAVMLHSTTAVGDFWLVSGRGYILPESYVAVKTVEKAFRTPGRMQYFLLSSSKARLRTESEPALIPSFRDQTLVALTSDICISLFGKTSVATLNDTQQRRLVNELHRRFSADILQLARILSIPQATLADILDRG